MPAGDRAVGAAIVVELASGRPIWHPTAGLLPDSRAAATAAGGAGILSETETAAAGGGAVPRDALPFDTLMAAHRGARRQLQLYLLALVVLGLGLVGLGLFGLLPQLPALVVGIVTLAVAVFPYREMVERDERIEGLHVLQDEWRELMTTTATPQQDTDRFAELLWKLYGTR